MNTTSETIVPNWPVFSRIWKIVAILLALLCFLLWLMGYGPGRSNCAVPVVATDASDCEQIEDDTLGDSNATVSMGAAGVAAAGALAADSGAGIVEEIVEELPSELPPAEILVDDTVVDGTGVDEYDLPAYSVDDSIAAARLYFASASHAVPGDAAGSLASVLAVLAQRSDSVAIISGFHDPSGSLAYNQELSKNRAVAVRDVMTSLGIDEERLLLERPVQTTGSGSKAEARRVEVAIATLN